MGSFKEITGDLFEGIFNGDYDVTASGLNCFNTQGAGIIIPFKNYFNTDKFPMELSGKGDINKLGQIDYKLFTISNHIVNEFNEHIVGDFNIYVCNLYTQYNYGYV